MAPPVETTAHPLRSAVTRWRERTDRASMALLARMTEIGQSGSHDIQKPPRAAGDGAGAVRSCGEDDLGAGRLAGRVSADEHGFALAVGVDQAEVAAQGEEHGREAALVDEAALDGGPVAVRARRSRVAAIGREPAVARQFREEGQGLGRGAPPRMDDQVDGSAPTLSAEMIVEHETVDADDRSKPPPTCGIGGIAAVAEGACDVFGGIAAQGLGQHPAVPWMKTVHGYAADGSPRSWAPGLPARRRRRSARRIFWRSAASLRRQESPSMATISALWTRRSTRATTQEALGKASPHSENGRLAVMIVAGAADAAPHMRRKAHSTVPTTWASAARHS